SFDEVLKEAARIQTVPPRRRLSREACVQHPAQKEAQAEAEPPPRLRSGAGRSPRTSIGFSRAWAIRRAPPKNLEGPRQSPLLCQRPRLFRKQYRRLLDGLNESRSTTVSSLSASQHRSDEGSARPTRR